MTHRARDCSDTLTNNKQNIPTCRHTNTYYLNSSTSKQTSSKYRPHAHKEMHHKWTNIQSKHSHPSTKDKTEQNKKLHSEKTIKQKNIAFIFLQIWCIVFINSFRALQPLTSWRCFHIRLVWFCNSFRATACFADCLILNSSLLLRYPNHFLMLTTCSTIFSPLEAKTLIEHNVLAVWNNMGSYLDMAESHVGRVAKEVCVLLVQHV